LNTILVILTSATLLLGAYSPAYAAFASAILCLSSAPGMFLAYLWGIRTPGALPRSREYADSIIVFACTQVFISICFLALSVRL
jgi:hypothetical protein